MESRINAESLIEARQILELAAVKLAAERRALEDLRAIKARQNAFRNQILDRSDGIEEDLMFHLKVVGASKNDVLKSLFTKIIPDLLVLLKKAKEQDSKESFKAIYEHDKIIEQLINQNSEEAVAAMKLHLEK